MYRPIVKKIFMSINSVCAVGIEICQLMGCFKMMSPKVQFNFKMDFGGLVEFQLHNTSNVRIDQFNINAGLDILDRKLLENFKTGKMAIHCSHQRKMKQIYEKGAESVFISCIVCYVPLFSTNDHHLESEHSKEYTPGSIKIQIYGPNGLPFNISLISNAISLEPHIFLPWSDFGFQVKRKFKSSTYHLECAARQRFEAESQGTICDRFIIVINFMVAYKHVSIQEKKCDKSNLKDEIDLLAYLEKVCQRNDALSIYQEVAMSCLNVIFIQNKKTTKEQQTSIQNTKKRDYSTVYEKLVPGVVTSLIDIFTRSVNSEFRSEAALLIPTDSRHSMSKYLETKLMGLIQNPSLSASVSSAQLFKKFTQNLIQPILNEEDDRNIDDWNCTMNFSIDKTKQPSCPVMASDADKDLQSQTEISDLFIDEVNRLKPGQISNTNTNVIKTCFNASLDNLEYNKYSCNTIFMKNKNFMETTINNADDKNYKVSENAKNIKDLSEMTTPFVQNNQVNSQSDIFCEPMKVLNHQCMHSMQLLSNIAENDSYKPKRFIESVSLHGNSSMRNKRIGSKSSLYLDVCPASAKITTKEYLHKFPRKRDSVCEDFTTKDIREPCDKKESRNYYKKKKITPNAAEILRPDQTLTIDNEKTDVENDKESLQMNPKAWLSNNSKQDQETDWFDESEVEKWFAEMEN